jgi:drug/metabolite transporter (DMT)-like permease
MSEESENRNKVQNEVAIDDKQKNITATVFFGFIIAALAIIIIGGIWSIGDLFSQDKFGAFLNLDLPFQILITGVIVIVLFFLGIFFLILFRRGKNRLKNSLFPSKPKDDLKDKEEYLPAKIITAGALVGFCVIFIGLFWAFIESLITMNNEGEFWNFLQDFTGGNWVLLAGLILLALTGLVLGAFYSWQNGYYFFLNRILKRAEKITIEDFKKGKRITAQVIFVIFVIGIISIILGIVWTIVDSFLEFGETFSAFPMGFQFSFMGILATSLFGFLIIALMLFRWGNKQILNTMFGKKSPDLKRDNITANIITIGILLGIFLIAVSLFFWLGILIANLLGGSENLFIVLLSMSAGLLIMAIGIIVVIILLLVLAFSYSYNNGYALVLKRIVKLDSSLR